MNRQPTSKFLDIAALSALAHLRFVAGQRMDGTYSGRHSSRSTSGSGEFADYREYSPGEDLRRLDWRVLGRTGRAYVRLFQDETNLQCTLVIDASASMLFGSPRGALQSRFAANRQSQGKLSYVQYLATGLSHIISRQQDMVGLAVVADGLTTFLAPGAAPTHVARLQQKIATLRTDWHTNLTGGLQELYSRSRRRGVLVVFSDFLVDDLEMTFGILRMFRQRRDEVALLHVIHPDEERLPEGNAFRFVGLEHEGTIDCRIADVRQQYEQRFAAHIALVRALAISCGCTYQRVSTATPYIQTLRSLLHARGA